MKTRPALKETGETIAVILALFSLTAVAAGSGDPCLAAGSDDPNASQAGLVGVQLAQATCENCVNSSRADGIDGKQIVAQAQNLRVPFQDYRRNKAALTGGDADLAHAIDVAAATTVKITEVTERKIRDLNGNEIKIRGDDGKIRDAKGKELPPGLDYVAGGIIASDSCYVYTSQHVVNDKKQSGVDKFGRPKFVSDESRSPINYSVKMLVPDRSGKLQEMKGKVVKVMHGPNTIIGDVALIRLERSAPVDEILRFGSDDFDRMASFPLATADYASDAQGGIIPNQLMVQSCRLNRQKTVGGILVTKCQSAPGGSGTGVIARTYDKRRGFEYSWTGLQSVGADESESVSPGELFTNSGNAVATDARDFAAAMEDFIRNQLKTLPCNE